MKIRRRERREEGRGQWRPLLCLAISLFSFLSSLFVLPSSLFAASGESGAAFLNIPVGARPAAMGSAYSALADDVQGAVWNPGALGRVQGTELAGQHLTYLESIHYEYAGFARAWRPGRTFAGAIQYLGSGDITGRDPEGAPTGTFSSYYAAYTLAYGHRVNDQWSLGASGKFLQAKLDETGAHAWAGSLGALWTPQENWRVGAVLDNAGTDLKFISSRDPLPLSVRLGSSYETARWTASLEPVWTRAGDLSLRSGFEVRPLPMLALRAGYRTDRHDGLSAFSGFSTGLGVQFWGQELAYAWLPYDDLGDTHYVSLLLRFEDTRKEPMNLMRSKPPRRPRNANKSNDRDEERMQLMQLLDEGFTPQTAKGTRD